MIPIQESERLFSKQGLILSSTVLVTLKELRVLTNKLKYAHKKSEQSPTSSTISFNRLSNSNVKILTICLGLWCLR